MWRKAASSAHIIPLKTAAAARNRPGESMNQRDEQKDPKTLQTAENLHPLTLYTEG